VFAYLRFGHKEAKYGMLVCESVDWSRSLADDNIWRMNGRHMHNGKRCLMLEAGDFTYFVDEFNEPHHVVVGTTQRVNSKTPMCSIVVYGNTLVKRQYKENDQLDLLQLDPLQSEHIFCVHPDDFVTKENEEMVEVFVTSPWTDPDPESGRE